MAKNIAEMRLVLKEIKANPETWDQTIWARRTACGTKFCFAGYVVHRAGYQMAWDRDGLDGPAGACWVDGMREPIRDVAQEILGLTRFEGRLLFNGYNTLDQIEALVDSWEAGEFADIEEFADPDESTPPPPPTTPTTPTPPPPPPPSDYGKGNGLSRS